jgi:hypothetical protein
MFDLFENKFEFLMCFFFLKKLTLHENGGLIWCDFIDLEYLNIIWMTDTNIIWLKKLK